MKRRAVGVFGKRRSSQSAGQDPVLREAAQWLARADLGKMDQEAFEAWRADPRHALAFLRVSEAARRAAEDPVMAKTVRPGLSRRSMMGAGLGVLSIGGGALVAGKVSARDRASTPIGGLRRVELAHAGALTLNTDSAVSWKAQGDRLRLWLERGEIALDLMGRSVPVHLQAGAVGAHLAPGRYNARLRDGLLDLVILSGQASADGATRSNAADPAVRGPHALVLTPDRPLVRSISEQDVAATLAWRSGEILFVDEPLSVAVEEYNRHLVRKIVLADPQLGGLRVGGRFTADDPTAFLRALQATMNVRLTASDEALLLSRKNS
jgi:transmembrane sensor